MTKLTVFGCGYAGLAIARSFSAAGAHVCGTTRSVERLDTLQAAGVHSYVFDGEKLEPALLEAMRETTHLVQAIAPVNGRDPLLAIAQGKLQRLTPKLQWIGYLSTAGVYGDHGGAWIEEEAATSRLSRRAAERLKAENGWVATALGLDIPGAILRLAAIYGPGRNALVNLKRGTARRIVKKDQVFNRIRVEDIGAAVQFLARRNLGGTYNLADDFPAPPQDLVVEAARLMGIAPPPEEPIDAVELSPMAMSFYEENKRVSNRKLKAEGFQFSYPSYPLSLLQIFQSSNW